MGSGALRRPTSPSSKRQILGSLTVFGTGQVRLRSAITWNCAAGSRRGCGSSLGGTSESCDPSDPDLPVFHGVVFESRGARA